MNEAHFVAHERKRDVGNILLAKHGYARTLPVYLQFRKSTVQVRK